MSKVIPEKEYMLMVAQFAAAATTNNRLERLIAATLKITPPKSVDPIEYGELTATKVLAKFGYSMPTDGNNEAQQFAEGHE